MTSKRIAYFITEDWVFVSHRLELAKASIKAGYTVYLITNVSTFAPLIESAGITIFPVNFKRGNKNIFRDLLLILQIKNFLKKESIDLLHNVAIKPILYGTISAFLARTPKVINAITGRGSLFLNASLKGRVLQRAFLYVLRIVCKLRTDAFLFQNQDDIDFFKEHKIVSSDRHEIALIRGAGVDLDTLKFQPPPQGAPIFVLMARLIWDKGIQEFIDAIQILQKKGSGFSAILVGKPDEENPKALKEETIKEWVKLGIVNWVGYQSDLNRVYANAHVAVLPSYAEGLPKSLLEAGSCGKPIITTDVPGCREMVVEGKNGMLVKVKSSESLANAMAFFIDNPNCIEEMGRHSRELIGANFSSKYVHSETIKLYRNLLG